MCHSGSVRVCSCKNGISFFDPLFFPLLNLITVPPLPSVLLRSAAHWQTGRRGPHPRRARDRLSGPSRPGEAETREPRETTLKEKVA